MSKIRADLVGTVFIPVEAGSPLALVAGDEVPDGTTVGDHLLEDRTEGDEVPDGTTVGDVEPKAPHGNASRETWAEYAALKGIEVEDDFTRDDIKALVKAQD